VDIITSEGVGKTLAAGIGAVVPSVAERELPSEAQSYLPLPAIARAPEASAAYASGFRAALEGGEPSDEEQLREVVDGLLGVASGLGDPHLRGFRTAGGLAAVALLWAGRVLDDPELRSGGKRLQEANAAVLALVGGRIPEAVAAGAELVVHLENENPDELTEVLLDSVKRAAQGLQAPRWG
jgi:hypothetical protein